MSKNEFFAAAFALAFVAGAARAQSEALTLNEVAALPIASAAAPAVLSTASAAFVVKGVDAGAYATMYTLERVPDGQRISVEIATRGVRRLPVPTGELVTATGLSTGTVLSAGSEAIAFVPNALGRALMRDARTAA